MVKGTAKQAVIVSPKESSGVEQAIFILSPQNNREKLEKPEDLLRLADRIAGQYTVSSLPKSRRSWQWLGWAVSFVLGVLCGTMVV